MIAGGRAGVRWMTQPLRFLRRFLVNAGTAGAIRALGLFQADVFFVILSAVEFLFEHGLGLDRLEFGLEVGDGMAVGAAIGAATGIGEVVPIVLPLFTRSTPLEARQ